MRRYQRLADEKTNKRRSIADVVAALEDRADFSKTDRARVRVGQVGVVLTLFEPPSSEVGYAVALPTSTQFLGRSPNSSTLERFDIARLDGAIFDGAGNVRLADGVALRAVEVIPNRLPSELDELDWRLAHLVIRLTDTEARCYRSVRDGLPPELQERVPDLRFIDWSKLRGLPHRLRKVMTSLIRERDLTFRDVSDQTIADRLFKLGIRIPKARPRKNFCHKPSTFPSG